MAAEFIAEMLKGDTELPISVSEKWITSQP